MTQTTLSSYFVESYPDEKLHRHAHNSLPSNPVLRCQSMQTSGAMWQRLGTLFGSFLWNARHPSKFWHATIDLWREKKHAQARCKFSSRSPASWAVESTAASSSKSASRAKSKHFASKRLIFWKSGPDWDICASAVKLFLREIHPEYRCCEFGVSLVCHFAWLLRRRF